MLLQYRNGPEWAPILSYLTLEELENFSQAELQFKRVVKTFLANGNKLLIDVATLAKYPIETNNALYEYYGKHATNICISGALDCELRKLFKWFSNIKELTLTEVTISDHRVPYPWSLTKLSLIDCEVNLITLAKLFGPMNDLLELHLEKCGRVNLPFLPKLQSLTVIKQMAYTSHKYPLLEKLTIDSCWNSISYATVKSFPQLQHLKVLKSVDDKAKGEIEALSLKTVKLQFCYEIPEKENLILELNDDCLLYLQQFLSYGDRMSLFKTHSRFQELGIPKYIINERSLEVLPVESNRQFYEQIGASVTHLGINQIEDTVFRQIMPLFKKLTELRVYFKDTSNDVLSSIPSGLRALHLFNVTNNTAELFRRLNETLEKLHLNNKQQENSFAGNGLDELYNIHEFRCEREILTDEFLRFLRLNQDHMRMLVVRNPLNSHLNTNFWKVISGMDKLRTFGITHPGKVAEGSFPMLEELTIVFGLKEGTEDLLKAIHGTELLSLVIGRCTDDVKGIISAILRFKKLESLEYAVSGRDLIGLVEGLPKLINIETRGTKSDEKTLIQIRDYCVKNNRKLIVNDIQLV